MKLKQGVLTPLETLAQSVAGIAPSATPGMLIPIIFGFAGNGSWLTFVLATIGILLTAQCINEFASRSACAGSLYTFVTMGSGSRLGMLTGWALMFSYVFCTAACITEFSIYAGSLCTHLLQITIADGILLTAAALLIGFIAYKNIKLSASLMLKCEFISMTLIVVLMLIALYAEGFKPDLQQLNLSGVKFDNVRMGLVMAIFGFAAFESAASLGVEACEPLHTIPKAIMRSVVISGVFFVLSTYAMVMTFHHLASPLEKTSTPLLAMANYLRIPALGQLIDGGILVSFFAAGLANLNAGARIIYKMSEDGHFHSRLANVHNTNQTPHIAVAACSVVSLLIALGLAAQRVPLLDIVGWLGTLATFGFIIVYLNICISAAFLLRQSQALTPVKLVVITGSTAVLLCSLVGSLWPAPAYPYNILPWLFAAYMIIGWLRTVYFPAKCSAD
jgi:amino acid transporter